MKMAEVHVNTDMKLLHEPIKDGAMEPLHEHVEQVIVYNDVTWYFSTQILITESVSTRGQGTRHFAIADGK